MIRKFISSVNLKKFQSTGELFIGTFDYYRKTENEKIRDENEGLKKYDSTGEQFSLSQKEIDAIQKDSSSKIISNNKDKSVPLIHIQKGGKLQMNTIYPNAFLFCTSEGNIEEMKKNLIKIHTLIFLILKNLEPDY